MVVVAVVAAAAEALPVAAVFSSFKCLVGSMFSPQK